MAPNRSTWEDEEINSDDYGWDEEVWTDIWPLLALAGSGTLVGVIIGLVVGAVIW